MKRIYSFLFAILTLAATTGVFTSCQEDAPEIDYTINITVNNDFTEVVDAINNGTLKQEAAIAALTAAIEKMNGEQNEKMDAIVKAINDLAKTTDAKLAIIEAAMKAQTLALEAKLDLLTAAVKAQTLKQEEMGKLLATAIDNLSGTLEEKLAAIEAIIESTSATLAEKIAAVEAAMKAQTLALENKLALLETAIKNIPDYSEKMDAIEAAIKNAPDYTTALKDIKDAIAALPNYTEQLVAIITAIEELPDYGDKLTAIKDAIPTIPNYEDQFAAIELALAAIADNIKAQQNQYADELAALKTSIDAIKSEVAAGNTSQENALEQIIALLESGALAGGGSGSGSGGSEDASPFVILEVYSDYKISPDDDFYCISLNFQDAETVKYEGTEVAEKYAHLSSGQDFLKLYDQNVTTIKVRGNFPSFNWCNTGYLKSIDISNYPGLQHLSISNCEEIESIKISKDKNTELIGLYCRGCDLDDDEMTALVESLPDRTGKEQGTFSAKTYWPGPYTIENVLSSANVNKAKAKNWKVVDNEGNELEGDF